MKAIAMVELPDDALEWGDGQWMIDDEGAILYKEDDVWMHYEYIDANGIELRPFLLGEELQKVRGGIKNKNTLIGYNMAIAICNKHLGENNESNISD